MTRRSLCLALLLAPLGVASTAPAAQAQYGYYRDDRYRNERYFRGRDSAEMRRRDVLRNRLFDLADRVRLAEREREISRNQADNFFRRLDRVRDFLRNDRYLTDSEFDRRMDDLDDLSRDLREECGRGRYRDRYRDDRYRDDRYRDDRYRRR